MKLKRFLSSVLALVLIVSLPVSALAADWYLEDGDITVSADSSGQTVSQGSTSVADDAPVIKQRDSSAATDSTITISTSDDATANVTIEDVNISSENGEFTVTAEGEGTVEKILYGGSETVPTAPGTYPVTCVVRLDDETIEFQIGTFVVPEPKSPAEAVQSAPLYRVTDKDGVDIAYKAEKNDGVLTITADEDHAVLTGTLAGIEQLKAQGVEKIVFVTNGASSAFSLNDLLEKGEIGETYKLTHDGNTVTFTLGEKMTDISLAYR